MNLKFKKAIRRVALSFTILLIIGFVLSLLLSTFALKTTDYTVENPKIGENIRIVVLSDLHSSRFGKDNKRLIEKVKKQNPDLIFTVGDMLNNNTIDFSYLSTLYKSLGEIAPVYCTFGNHETSHPDTKKIHEIISEHAVLLRNDYREITVKDCEIRIGGLEDYHPSRTELDDFLKDFADTHKLTLLICHCPEHYTWGADNVKTDLMVSGHTHGGQIIIPFKGGLFAPEQGYFPHFDYGVFHEENSTLVISKGLGTSDKPIPRFNNIPEILSLTLSPEVNYEQHTP